MSNMYESGSLPSQFKPHQQGPKPLSVSVFGKVIIPTAEIIYERPSYVILNKGGTYAFNYDFTGSFGAAVSSTELRAEFITGSYLGGTAPIELPISPTAWREIGSDVGTAGDITFVYRGGL